MRCGRRRVSQPALARRTPANSPCPVSSAPCSTHTAAPCQRHVAATFRVGDQDALLAARKPYLTEQAARACWACVARTETAPFAPAAARGRSSLRTGVQLRAGRGPHAAQAAHSPSSRFAALRRGRAAPWRSRRGGAHAAGNGTGAYVGTSAKSYDVRTLGRRAPRSATSVTCVSGGRASRCRPLSGRRGSCRAVRSHAGLPPTAASRCRRAARRAVLAPRRCAGAAARSPRSRAAAQRRSRASSRQGAAHVAGV